MDPTTVIGQIFNACDLDGSGYIDEKELSKICQNMSKEEFKDIFKELDKDGDGKISISEFEQSYYDLTAAFEKKKGLSEQKRYEQSLKEELDNDDIMENLDERFSTLSW